MRNLINSKNKSLIMNILLLLIVIFVLQQLYKYFTNNIEGLEILTVDQRKAKRTELENKIKQLNTEIGQARKEASKHYNDCIKDCQTQNPQLPIKSCRNQCNRNQQYITSQNNVKLISNELSKVRKELNLLIKPERDFWQNRQKKINDCLKKCNVYRNSPEQYKECEKTCAPFFTRFTDKELAELERTNYGSYQI
jgi:hypothetical protein